MRAIPVWFTLVCLLNASDWPRFRGPNGTGISQDQGLPSQLSPDRNVLWKQNTVKGHSSPIVAAGKLWITGHDGDQRLLACYDAANGRLLWKKQVTRTSNEPPNPLNGPTTPTPATDGNSVFVFFPDFGLMAYDFAGNERWRVPMGPFGGIQGMAVSPIVVEDKVILLIDTPEEAMLQAFDAGSGKLVWKTERPIGLQGSYTTPSVYKPASGPTEIVVSGAVELAAYQAGTGERLWWAHGVTSGPAALPLIYGEVVYTLEPSGVGGGGFKGRLQQFDKNKDGKIELAEIGDKADDRPWYRTFKSVDRNFGNGDGVVTEEEWNRAFSQAEPSGGLVCTRLNGKGDVSKTHVGWRQTKSIPYVNAALVYGNIMYVVRNGGILSTFDPESGKLLREERLKNALGEYYSQLIAGDGKVYFINKDGKTTVIRAGADWEILSSGDLDEQVIATPAISGSRIFVRTEEHLYCFGEK